MRARTVKGYLILVVIFFNIISGSFAQQERSVALANVYYKKGNYAEAIKEYEKLAQTNKEGMEVNAQLARCYLLSSYKTKALKYALQLKNLSGGKVSEELSYIIARAYHLNNNFDSAIYYYQHSGNEVGAKHVSKLIGECQYAKDYMAHRVNADVINVGRIVNTESAEFMPFITADKSKLYYTAFRRKEVAMDESYSEDIYYSESFKGQWQSPRKVESLSSDGHEACAGISDDGMIMFVYKGTNNGDLFITELKGHAWTKPEKFQHNTPGFEGSATLSPDGKTLYYVHQPVGSDNRDIYTCSKMYNSQWSKPVKLEGICTEYDEDCPFMHPDGKTLYFSSKGHTSMGGFDIFSSTIKDDLSWSTPENIGYPINTPGDDINFTMSADGKNGYYSSDIEGGYGKQDIYTIRFNTRVLHDLELLVGNVIDASSGRPMEADITVTDNNSNAVVGTYHSNAEDGHFMIALPCGRNYGIHIENKGYLFYSENAKLECAQGYFEISKNIQMQQAQSGSKIVLSNIFFESGKADLSPESRVELLKIVNFLKKNPELNVEISGHTDISGNENDNKTLSTDRAAKVKAFILENGIDESRLVARGYGSAMPIADNISEEGKRQNRRTEFKIL
ncbi:MAG TPA: OmpA family protein [Cytophagaceae bacterium]|nr:OmpA family protein [Cytophagaceae bacterium]